MEKIAYAFLIENFNLELPLLNTEYYKGDSQKREVHDFGCRKRVVLSSKSSIQPTVFDNLKAAIKYQGIRLQYLYAIFQKIDTQDLAENIKAKPHAKEARVIWFLYEWLMNEKLDIPDLTTGSYIKLFDDRYYYTLKAGQRDSRTRITNNALGTKDYCPIIRKTKDILSIEGVDFYETAFADIQELSNNFSASIVESSIDYLYTKETKTSSQIEHEEPGYEKLARFKRVLKTAGLYQINKKRLLSVRNHIIEEAKKVTDYRTDEIFVGETVWGKSFPSENIHYIGPLAKHVDSMMDGLIKMNENLMLDGGLPSLMHATLVSFGLVYIHPFDDGNGRTHRFLLHDIIKHRDDKIKIIIPISAAILKNRKEYDEVLDTLSAPILNMIQYYIDSDNDSTLVVNNDIDYMYRYPDFTDHVQFIYRMMDKSIKVELADEVFYLGCFEVAKQIIQASSDVSDKNLSLIVNMILRNNGKMSKKKSKFILQHISQKTVSYIEEQLEEIQNRLGFKLDNLN